MPSISWRRRKMAKKASRGSTKGLRARVRNTQILASLAIDTAYSTDIRALFRRIQLAVREVVDYDVYMCIILQGKDENYLFADAASAVSRSCVEQVRESLLGVTSFG